ncbi:alginate export family protein [Sphingomonas piscis]|uniref:Alginate export family protein n=2 Tax=Sphingomonas piscis TaxID=2714943 RepID=A0A6G7YT12_9SPHN|nr:alginate export family protein [Sphingomonas piscis]
MAQGASSAKPKDGFSFSGSVRLRYEYLTGQFRPGFDKSEDATLLRTILTPQYKSGKVRIGAELWDSRMWGGRGAIVGTGEVNTAELVQAYVAVDVDSPLGDGSRGAIQGGRMTLNLGSRRLIASDDYRNTTNGFTGIRADVAKGPTSATLLYLLPQRRLPDDLPSILDNEWKFDRESFDQRLWGGLVNHGLGRVGSLEATYLRFAERDDGSFVTRNRRLQTVGARFIREPKPNQWDYELEGIRQTGSIAASTLPGAARLPVRAGFVHAEVGYTFAGPWKPHLSLEYDWASGDGPGRRYTRFDTLFGMRRADLGPASLYNALGRANISAPGVRLEVTPSSRLDAFTTWRGLWADEPGDIFSTTGVRNAVNEERFGGHQLEGRVRYWLVPAKLRAEGNVAVILRDNFLRDAANVPTRRDTIYSSLSLTASF